MTKSVHDDALDQVGLYIGSNVNQLVLNSQAPSTFTEAQSTYALGAIAVNSTDLTQANGDTSGRKVTVAAQSSIGVGTTGNCNHASLVDTDNSKLLLVTEVTSQDLTSGNAASTNAFDDEIEDPT